MFKGLCGDKVSKVVNSCTTLAQLHVAYNYIKLAESANPSPQWRWALQSIWYDKLKLLTTHRIRK